MISVFIISTLTFIASDNSIHWQCDRSGQSKKQSQDSWFHKTGKRKLQQVAGQDLH